MPRVEPHHVDLPDDSESLKEMVRSLLEKRDGQRQRADELHVQNLRLQLELERYRKWYYGPRADRLQSSGDLAQLLLNFFEKLDRKPINPDDLPRDAKPEEELRRVKRRKGPATTCQLRKPIRDHPGLRTEYGATCVPVLRRRAP